MINALKTLVIFTVFLGLARATVDRKDWRRVLASPDIPLTSFSCSGRPVGYYADVEAKCQVYHMCGQGGRQFSYLCPDTTLFQQRMLVCAHWYQVNCSQSHEYYRANLLIGQQDRPFVGDVPINSGKQVYRLVDTEELQQLSRTPQRQDHTDVPGRSPAGGWPGRRGDYRGSRTWSPSSVERGDSRKESHSDTSAPEEDPYRMTPESRRNTWSSAVGGPPGNSASGRSETSSGPEGTTEPSPGAHLRPTYVSFRSTIETPRVETPPTLTAPMTPSSAATTPSTRLEGPPTLQIRFQDPRRTLYIPERGSRPPPDEEIVVRIPLRGKPRAVRCRNCDRELGSCSPCVLDP